MAPVSNQEQIIELQEDLASAFHGAGKWQMAFNPGKCKCVHFGHANPKHEHTMGAHKIAHSTEEKDLGVVINQSLSPSHHIATRVSRANRLVGLIKRTYANKSKRNIIAFSGRTLIIYCTFCKYVIVICRSYTSRPTCYYVLVFFILHHDVRMYDFLWAYSA